jgi:Uri superfamily endonuclease
VVKGIYVLVISVGKKIRINVGGLGVVNFEKGVYAYVGSAQNNLQKRIKRHLRKVKREFWHVDYLLGNRFVKVMKVFYKEARKSEECGIARKLAELGAPVLNFGCSDCDCRSHLFVLKDSDHLSSFMAFLKANFTRSLQA